MDRFQKFSENEFLKVFLQRIWITVSWNLDQTKKVLKNYNNLSHYERDKYFPSNFCNGWTIIIIMQRIINSRLFHVFYECSIHANPNLAEKNMDYQFKDATTFGLLHNKYLATCIFLMNTYQINWNYACVLKSNFLSINQIFWKCCLYFLFKNLLKGTLLM